MRNIILAILLALSLNVAYGTEGEGHIELRTDNLYRGELLPTNDVAVSAMFRLDDLFVDGLYVQTDIDTIEGLDPTEVPMSAVDCLTNKIDRVCTMTLSPRVYAAVGYETRLWGLMVDTSLARMFNPVLHDSDYFEVGLKVRTDLDLLDGLDVYGHVSHTFDGVEQWYVGGGLILEDVLVDDLELRAGVNFYHYERALTLSDWTRNNFEFSAQYEVLNDIELFSEWSIGHRGALGGELDNEYLFGVRFRF